MFTYGDLRTVDAKVVVNECDALSEELPRATLFELNELSYGASWAFATIDKFCGCPFARRNRLLSSSLGRA